jgi:diguanylate cyclase (GGDEF)-like protein/PAS domain S-box-containing protein
MMPMTFAVGFQIAMLLVICFNILIIYNSFRQKDKKGKYLAITCIFEILTGSFYTFSAVANNYTIVAVFSSLYFICIDFLLLSFLVFIVYWRISHRKNHFKIISFIIKGYLLFEIIIFIVNIFNPIAIEYIARNTSFMHYEYKMNVFYYLHLAYSYSLVIAIMSMLIVKCLKVPKEYRAPYLFIIYTFVIIVIINGIFLFLPKNSDWLFADYAVLFYFIGSVICYWACYVFPKKGMLNHFKTFIFENIDQGIVLYDYQEAMLVINDKAKRFFSSIGITLENTLQEFLQKCNLSIIMDEDAYSLQCYINEYGKQKPLRCDYRMLRNERNEIIGRLFVFVDVQLDTDLLTGFHNWESFRKFAIENKKNFPNPTTVCVCDINKLSVFNTMYGRNKGDQLLKSLSETMRKIFPEDTYYVREQDAYLIAICYDKTKLDCSKYLKELSESFEEKIQYSYDTVLDEDENLVTVMHRVFAGLRAKKLLDKDSARSALISSLIRALKEADPDTLAHVERTQKLGQDLGERLGLLDIEQSRLSLLCLLHDIGKISIPLEVLNKPGKLTDDEWVVIKSHVLKGEAIANATSELKTIAKEIRYHHERWDGKGYPDGLSRESIPLLSRIISVIDSFDAMISNRPYRKAKSIEAAKEDLIHNAGSQFDPRMVEEFISKLNNGYEIPINQDAKVVPTQTITNDNNEETSHGNIHPMIYSKYIIDSEMRIVEIDKEFTEITGYTLKDIKEKELSQKDLLPKEDRADYILEVEKQLRMNSMAYIEHRILCKDGSIKTVYCFGRKYFDSIAREEKSEIVIVNSSTTYAAKLLAKSMEQKSEVQLKKWEDTYRRDSLTGLLTHIAFVNDIEQKRFECPELKSMLVMMDLDNFKKFNDTYGHHAGDEFLIQIGQVLLSVTKDHDLACRMGGDEFMLAIFVKPTDDYKKIAKEIFDKISMRISLLEKSTTFSVGVAVNDGTFRSFDEQYEAVDKVLYASKDAGKNRLSFYEDYRKEEHK